MIRIFIAVVAFVMAGCSVKSYDPEAAVEIRAPPSVQAELIGVTVAFGERNHFKVNAGKALPRDGRMVSRVTLERSDGTLIIVDNFMSEEVLDASFYAKQSVADWREAKESWLRDIRAALRGRGEIVEVSEGTD